MKSPKVFLLNDLEKKMKMKDLFKGGLKSMFAGKYIEAQNEKKILEEMFTPRVEIVPENHDWMYTPIYKQFVLKYSEDQSLKETNLIRSTMEIIFEERRKNQKIQQLQKINKVPLL
jgi:predicted HNH restriction endonuclease